MFPTCNPTLSLAKLQRYLEQHYFFILVLLIQAADISGWFKREKERKEIWGGGGGCFGGNTLYNTFNHLSLSLDRVNNIIYLNYKKYMKKPFLLRNKNLTMLGPKNCES